MSSLGKIHPIEPCLISLNCSSFIDGDSCHFSCLWIFVSASKYQILSKHKDELSERISVVPLVLFCILRFFTIGTTTVILTMLGELFPLKIRNIASGIATALVNVLTFGSIKTFYNLEYWTSLPGAFCVYAVLGVLG